MRSALPILIPLPAYGFDPTESAIPWYALQQAGHAAVFATPDGTVASADARMVSGMDLPLLLRRTLRASANAAATYAQMAKTPSYRYPIAYAAIRPEDYSGLLLPGGHDKGMRTYLESEVLQRAVAWFFDHDQPVGAICHGTLLAGRSVSRTDPERSGKSVLFGRKTTGLTRRQELIAFWLTRYTLADYYRTYPVPMADELQTYLRAPSDYDPGPGWPIPLSRDSSQDPSAGFTVLDRNYLSARWPGDAHRFAAAFVKLLATYRSQ